MIFTFFFCLPLTFAIKKTNSKLKEDITYSMHVTDKELIPKMHIINYNQEKANNI